MKLLIQLLIGVLFANQGLNAQESEFPPLHFTEIIQGTQKDIGSWGDGRVYLIDLWGTWCAPCIKNIPKLNRLQKKYKTEKLIIIGYSWENPEDVLTLVDRMGDEMTYTLVNDSKEIFLKVVAEEREMVESFPFVFLIGREGALLWSGNPEHGLVQELEQYFGR